MLGYILESRTQRVRIEHRTSNIDPMPMGRDLQEQTEVTEIRKLAGRRRDLTADNDCDITPFV